MTCACIICLGYDFIGRGGIDGQAVKAALRLITFRFYLHNTLGFACPPHRSGGSSDYPIHHKTAPYKGCCFVVGRGGFEPPKSKTSDLQSDPFGRSGICPYRYFIVFVVEPVIGLEPTTC